MRFVVDASVAVKWLIVEDDADIAEELATGGHDLHAPRLMASEVANALWHKARTGEIKHRAAGILLGDVQEMPVLWGAGEIFSPDAARLTLSLDHPIYDCVYLALAHRIGARVVTGADMSGQSVDFMQEITFPDGLTSLAVRFKSPFQGHGIREDGDRVKRLITKETPSRVAGDTAFRNAWRQSEQQNTRIEHDKAEHDKALMRVMTSMMKDDSQLFKQFVDKESFKCWIADTVFDIASKTAAES